jgi:hypothetical protein
MPAVLGADVLVAAASELKDGEPRWSYGGLWSYREMAYEETTSARVRSMDASMKRWTEWRELRKHVLLERGQRATDPSL